MLLKIGIAMMAAALLMAAGVGVFVLFQRDEPVVAATKAAQKSAEPLLRYGEPQRVAPEEPEPAPEAQVAETEAAPEKPDPAPKPAVEAESRSAPQPEPKPKPEPKPQPKPQPEPASLPAGETDWPMPSQEQIEAASGPRRYGLTPGAVMGLTIKALGVYDAPVYDSDSSWALDNGIMHVPETSMPWSGGAQRNVYLAGHRLGYPGTGSHLVFYHLDTLGRGDEVVLKRRDGKRYRYRVTESFVVGPSDSWVMGQELGKDLVTLQTCTPIPAFDKRLIVRAERV